MSQRSEILLVDDNAGEAEIFINALARVRPETTVHWVRGGEEALAFLRAGGNPKLVVLDLNMPGLSGLQTLGHIRSARHLRKLPVVVLSGSEKSDDVDSVYEYGGNVFLRKPRAFEEYLEIVRGLAQHWLHLAVLPSEISKTAAG